MNSPSRKPAEPEPVIEVSPTQARILDAVSCYPTGAILRAISDELAPRDPNEPPGLDLVALEDQLDGLRRMRLVADTAQGWHLTAAGWRTITTKGGR